MIVRIGMLRKKADASVETFRRYWREVHGLLGASLPGLHRYHQNHVVEKGRGLGLPVGPRDFDGFSELWFRDAEAMRSAFTPETSRTLAVDEAKFTSDLRGVAVAQEIVLPVPAAQRLVKHMSLLGRRSGGTSEEFRRAYGGRYAQRVRGLPGLRGYVQNVVVDRNVEKGGRSARYDEVPVDAVDELWFDDVAALEGAFASEAGLELRRLASGLLEAATPFVVEPLVLVA